MLTMVNGPGEHHQVSPSTSTSASASGAIHSHHHNLHLFTMNDENAVPPQRNIPVPVLVKHEEYSGSAAATASSTLSGDESSSSFQSASTTTASAKRQREKRSTKSKCPPGLRSGKWTPEEEAFTNMLIYYFKLGRLHVDDGTSLRWYLAKRLNCEAMRVTKKLKGNSSIGKQIFRALEETDENRHAIAAAAEELAIVEKAFTDSLAATGQATATTGAPTHPSASARTAKRASPHKPTGLPKPPHLEARKLVVPKVRESLANSEDAKLLLHFFVGAHDATSLEDPVTSGGTNVEKKRLFSEVDTSPSTASSSSPADSPTSKRRTMKMDDLVRTV